MILYTLRCEQNHHFEEWFSNSADYDEKAKAGELCCPDCGSKDVRKAIMAPSLGSSTSAAPAPEPSCGPSSCGTGMCPAMRG